VHASVAFIIDIAGAKQRSALAAADRLFSSIHSTVRQMVVNRHGYRGRTYATASASDFLIVLTIAGSSKKSITGSRCVPPSSTSVVFGRCFGYAQRRSLAANHVFTDAGFADFDAEFEQLAMNPWGIVKLRH
jgi:hypothetical protein